MFHCLRSTVVRNSDKLLYFLFVQLRYVIFQICVALIKFYVIIMDRPTRMKQKPKLLDDMIFQNMVALLFLVNMSHCSRKKKEQNLYVLFNASIPTFGRFAFLLIQKMYLYVRACITRTLFAFVSLCHLLCI